MVRRMGLSSLVDVLGSFASNVLHGKSRAKYRVIRCITCMCADMGLDSP